MTKISRDFFNQNTVDVAKSLLGKLLIHKTVEGITGGIIVETEAYAGNGDGASHAANGPTPRSKIMFGPPGLAYVYLNYGVHNLFNIVTGDEGTAGAVLIRALEPIEGLGLMKTRRKVNNIVQLCNGPGKLTQALEINLGHNGHDITRRPLYVEDVPAPDIVIGSSPRIGISKGTDKHWRFYIEGNQCVSKTPYRRINEAQGDLRTCRQQRD